ncbi:hypothetical protein PBI_GAIA_173 [Mycobacterium phage Gaia]|uniref:Uncharacterized protein n=1 Tax=Mycobacterium phage Gaia TaxID=1486472 RepID=A0A068F2N0_9CAUD|nr:hypothetical protein VC46_gp063 [Mycobacterium phage Gaia]AID58989.1 hypothetical protein PBI_GAIA_173 [Mycobacterium phage Gaia]
MGKQYVVWTYGGELEYELHDKRGDAFLAALDATNSDYMSLRGVESPEGVDITDEFREWEESREKVAAQSRLENPPKPKVAILTVKGLFGESVKNFYDISVAESAYREAVEQFGLDKVSMEHLPPKRLVWVGTWQRRTVVDHEQRRVNESREWFGKPILEPHETYRDEISWKREYREWDDTKAYQLLEFSTENRKVVVVGINKSDAEDQLLSYSAGW